MIITRSEYLAPISENFNTLNIKSFRLLEKLAKTTALLKGGRDKHSKELHDAQENPASCGKQKEDLKVAHERAELSDDDLRIKSVLADILKKELGGLKKEIVILEGKIAAYNA